MWSDDDDNTGGAGAGAGAGAEAEAEEFLFISRARSIAAADRLDEDEAEEEDDEGAAAAAGATGAAVDEEAEAGTGSAADGTGGGAGALINPLSSSENAVVDDDGGAVEGAVAAVAGSVRSVIHVNRRVGGSSDSAASCAICSLENVSSSASLAPTSMRWRFFSFFFFFFSSSSSLPSFFFRAPGRNTIPSRREDIFFLFGAVALLENFSASSLFARPSANSKNPSLPPKLPPRRPRRRARVCLEGLATSIRGTSAKGPFLGSRNNNSAAGHTLGPRGLCFLGATICSALCSQNPYNMPA